LQKQPVTVLHCRRRRHSVVNYVYNTIPVDHRSTQANAQSTKIAFGTTEIVVWRVEHRHEQCLRHLVGRAHSDKFGAEPRTAFVSRKQSLYLTRLGMCSQCVLTAQELCQTVFCSPTALKHSEVRHPGCAAVTGYVTDIGVTRLWQRDPAWCS